MINLYINYFAHSDPKRKQEIDACLKFNLDNPLINRIIVLAEEDLPFDDPKLVVLPTNKRPTFQDFFNLTRQYGEKDINIISNSDIGFNYTVGGVNSLAPNTCYALTRHELRRGVPIAFRAANGCPPHFSQDTWVFRGPIKLENCDRVLAFDTVVKDFKEIDFTMGVPGCDNVLAHYIGLSYLLKNPHSIIQCLHYHEEKSRPVYRFRVTGNRSKWGLLKKVNSSQL